MGLERSQAFLQQIQADLARSQTWLQQMQADLTQSQTWLQQVQQVQARQFHPAPHSDDTADVSVPQPLDPYEAWLRVNQWNDRTFKHLQTRLQACRKLPQISVVMPVFNPQVRFLEQAIGSVVQQVYLDWELCIADDGSTDPTVRSVLSQWAARDRRIRVTFCPENGNISAATNRAADLATSDYLLFLDHDDELTPNALGEVALYLAEHSDTDFLYSDDDKIDADGRRYAPQFKPDWSPELLLSYMYCSHLCVVSRSVFKQVGGMRLGFEGAQDYDFALRATEVARHVAHLPLVLYHWRSVPGSTAQAGSEKPASFLAGQRALQEALDRRGVVGAAFQPEWALQARCGIFEHQFPDSGASVAIVIPTKNQLSLLKACLTSLQKTTYRNYQVVVIDNESDDPETLAYLAQIDRIRLPVRVLQIANPEGKFNFAAINNRAVAAIDSDYVLFLNNDTEVIAPEWLSQMMGYAQLPGVGAVGAKLIYPDGRIQHAGVVHGLHHGLAGHAFKLMPAGEYGYLAYAKTVRNYSAVTAACLLTPRHLFLELGGFDQQQFAVAYNDVDYCYRLLQQGWRCVYSPRAELLHREGVSRGFVDRPQEPATFRQKYANFVDRFYSPHLSLEDEQFRVQPRCHVAGHINRRLRLLMCSHTLDYTGAALHLFEIATALKAGGHIEPVILCMNEHTNDGSLRHDYECHGIEVLRAPYPLQDCRNRSMYDRAIAQLAQQLTAIDVDVIYVNTVENFFVVDCAQSLKIPCVWNIHESEPWQTRFQRFGAEIAARALVCFGFPYKVIFVADATRDCYLPLNYNHNFAVIRNGLHLKALQQQASVWSRKSARLSLNVAADDVVLLLLGTVCDRKGQHDLPLALTHLPQRWHSKIKIFIVGDRELPYGIELKRIVARLPESLRERVVVVPEIKDTVRYYSAADILIFTSRMESFPRVILEGMAYGLPIITTPVFGVKEQVQVGVNALFYSPGHPQELMAAIVSLLQNPEQRSRFAENSRHVLNCHNSFQEMVQKYAAIVCEAYFSQNAKMTQK
jgi:GT2 family glycosyltransferase/glycosyltransferase involved in cell wall biosynthesis